MQKLSLLALLLFTISCQNDESINPIPKSNRLAGVIFQEYQGYIDTVAFHYAVTGRIDSVSWKVYNNHPYFPQTLISDYTEKRSYGPNGKLLSLNGGNIWSHNYQYTSGLLNTVIAYRDIGWVGELKYNSTTTYQKYTGLHPVQLKVESYIGSARNIEIEYDPDWNINKMKINGEEPEYEITIEYSSELNPLRNLFETGLFGLYGYHEHRVFYYSKNLPHTITRDRIFSQDPSYIERTFFQYTYSKDGEGRITGISVHAKITDNFQNEWYNDKAYDMQFQYQ